MRVHAVISIVTGASFHADRLAPMTNLLPNRLLLGCSLLCPITCGLAGPFLVSFSTSRSLSYRHRLLVVSYFSDWHMQRDTDSLVATC